MASCTQVLRDMMPAVRDMNANADRSVVSASGWPFPPCIIIERGESLDKWAERLKPDFVTILQVRVLAPPELRCCWESAMQSRRACSPRHQSSAESGRVGSAAFRRPWGKVSR